MFDDIGAILLPFGELLGLVDEAGDGFDLLGGIIERMGFAVMAALTPVRMILKAMRGIVQTGSALLSGDFAGALEAIKQTGSNIFDVGVEGMQAVGSTYGMDNANAAADKSSPQQVSVSGNIGISAGGGSKIDNAEINLDGGGNIAYAR